MILKVYAFAQRTLLLTDDFSIYVLGLEFNMMPIDKYKLVKRQIEKPRLICMGLDIV
jgi:hypothetical protein